MAQKLFHAEVTFHYYFLAEEDEAQEKAEEFMDEAIENDGGQAYPEVNEVSNMEGLLDWDDHDCLVYSDHKEDISLKKAFEMTNGITYEQGQEAFKNRLRSER